jgi:phage-related minor tail protein
VPIYLDIMSRLDDVAARKAADQAGKYFADTGKRVGTDFGKAISDGLASSDGAVRKSAENVEKAYKKAQDAAGAVRVEEAKLDDLRTKGTGATALLAQTEKLEKARRAEISTSRESVTALHDLDSAHQVAAGSGSLLASALEGIAQAGAGTRIGGIASSIEGIGTGALAAIGGITAVGAAVVGVTKGLYDLGAEWTSISDDITIRTGKMGNDLKALNDTVGNIGNTTAAPLGTIGEIVGQLSQSMPGLAENNTALEQMGSNLAFLAAHGVEVNIHELGMAFSAFNVNVADQVKTLDDLTNVSQKTGIPLNELIHTATEGAPQFKQFGLSLGQSTGLLASFDEAGISGEKSVTALRVALGKLANDPRGAAAALADVIDQIKKFHDASQEASAIDLAKTTFGTRNFAPFLDAIESGKVGVEGLKKAVEETGRSVKDMQDNTDHAAEAWQKLSNHLDTVLKPAGQGVFSIFNDGFELMTGHLDGIISRFTTLDFKAAETAQHVKDAASVQITPDSALGKMLLPAGSLLGNPEAPTPGDALNRAGTTGIQGSSDFWGYQHPSTKSGAPGTPQVPYDTTLPQGFSGIPQTSEILGAENSWMDARHSVAEKQAALDQLEKDHNAKADDITKAKNDLINAQQSQNQAELRLNDARTSLYTKENKALTEHTAALGEFGAALDKDLGISKGLSGIADNLVRFLGNLALAPEMAKLNAIANAPGQAQGGFGLIGQLGAQGVFGPQYTAAGQAAAGSAGYQGQAVMLPDGSVGTYGATGYRAGTPPGAPQPGAAMTSLVGPGGSGTSPNGFPLFAPEQSFSVNGVSTQAAAGAPAQRLQNFAQWFNDNIEPVKQFAGYDAGGHGLGTRSNHASGTALDINWDDFTALQGHGADARSHFSEAQMQAISQELTQTGMTWGQYWTPDSRDPGHFELGGAPYSRTGPQNIGPTSGQPSSPAGGGWGGPGIPSTIPAGVGGLGPVWGSSPRGPGIGASAIPGGPGLAAPAAGGTPIGAAVGPPSGSGQGGIGITPGGSLDSAMGIAASMFPGVGQAAQTGVKLASRAIQFGGQAAAIGMQGLMQTFLPTGGSDLANNSWFSKIAGGLAGAAPALPNVAGKKTTPHPQQGQQGQQQQGGGDTHITNNVTNQRATEDGTGRDIAWHMQNAYQPAGQP